MKTNQQAVGSGQLAAGRGQLNFKTSPKAQRDSTLEPCHIEVAGKIVGDLEAHRHTTSLTWHATLRLHDDMAAGYFQGNGDTQEAAVADAIKKGRTSAVQRLNLVEEFAAAVGYYEHATLNTQRSTLNVEVNPLTPSPPPLTPSSTHPLTPSCAKGGSNAGD